MRNNVETLFLFFSGVPTPDDNMGQDRLFWITYDEVGTWKLPSLDVPTEVLMSDNMLHLTGGSALRIPTDSLVHALGREKSEGARYELLPWLLNREAILDHEGKRCWFAALLLQSDSSEILRGMGNGLNEVPDLLFEPISIEPSWAKADLFLSRMFHPAVRNLFPLLPGIEHVPLTIPQNAPTREGTTQF